MSLCTCTDNLYDEVQNIDTTNKNPSDFRDTAGGKNKRRGSESGVSRNEKTALISSLAASSASASQK